MASFGELWAAGNDRPPVYRALSPERDTALEGKLRGACGIQPGMSAETQLEKALDKLRKGGTKIGAPETIGGETMIPVNGVLMTPEKIFALADISPNA